MISIRNLVKHYGKHVALDHIELSVGKGVILGLLGPNGAGKTTLVSILNGLIDFQEGEVEIFGLSLRHELREIRKRSSFVPQSLALYENLTVMENLRFFATIQKVGRDMLHRNIDYALTVNGLHPMRDQKAVTLSGGQKRRLNIAIGLLNNPELLFSMNLRLGSIRNHATLFWRRSVHLQPKAKPLSIPPTICRKSRRSVTVWPLSTMAGLSARAR